MLLFFYLFIFMPSRVPFHAFVLRVHHLQSYSARFVMNVVHRQCCSSILVFELKTQMHNQAALFTEATDF